MFVSGMRTRPIQSDLNVFNNSILVACRSGRLLGVFFSFWMIAGCGVPDRPIETIAQNSDGDVQPVQGYVIMGAEIRTFQACGEDVVHWLRGDLGQVNRMYSETTQGQDPYTERFASLFLTSPSPVGDGFQADYDSVVEVKGVNYWPFEGFGCDYQWDAFMVRAMGNEPFWMATLAEDGLSIRRPMQEEVVIPVGKDGLAWESEDDSIRLELADELCQDSMSGTWHAFGVVLDVDGLTLTGCGLRGGL